jgi:hypothetical protein
MVQWWLNFSWASGAYAETLARIDLAILLLGGWVLVAYALSG